MSLRLFEGESIVLPYSEDLSTQNTLEMAQSAFQHSIDRLKQVGNHTTRIVSNLTLACIYFFLLQILPNALSDSLDHLEPNCVEQVTQTHPQLPILILVVFRVESDEDCDEKWLHDKTYFENKRRKRVRY